MKEKMKAMVLIIFILSLSSMSMASKYKLDTSHSYIGFKTKYMAFSTVRGKFDKFNGSANFDKKSGKISNLKASIVVNSIDTNEPDRDKHLKSADFFDVKKFKKLTFSSSHVNYKKGKPVEIIGKITIHGVSKKITLKITEWGGTVVDPWGNHRLAFESSASIDRRDFGLKWNKGFNKVGGLMVSNKVQFVLQLQAIKID